MDEVLHMTDAELQNAYRGFSLRECTAAAVLTLPLAPNQNRPIDAFDLMHYAVFVVLAGVVGYLGTLWVLWFFTHFMRFAVRCPFRKLHRASSVFGVAFALSLLAIGFAMNIVPKGILGITEVGFMLIFFITALVLAIRILRRVEHRTETGSLSGGPK
jgi:hypothetical protein